MAFHRNAKLCKLRVNSVVMNLQSAFIVTSHGIGETIRLKPIVVFVVMLLLFSETFGQSWSVNYTPRFRHLKQIHQLGRDIVTMVGGWPQNDSISYMAYTNDGGQLWHFEDIFPGAMLNAAVFFNDGRALAAGYNEKLYKSSNRGRNWTLSSFNVNLNHRNINAMVRYGSNTCFAAGGLHNAGGFIIHSADAGETWSMLHQNNETEFVALHILPTGSLLASGTDSNIFYSDNAAENWQLAQVEPAIDNMQINAFAFVDASTGFCVGGRQGSDSILLIMKTIDGGQHWSEVLRRSDPVLNDVCFVDQTTLLAVGDYGIILKSVDSGSTWSQYLIEGNPGYHLFSIDFANIHIGAISGQYGLYMLYNDGLLGLPEVSTYHATHVTSTKAELHAMVNAAFNEIELFFDYGITGGESHTVPMGTFTGGNPEFVNYTVSGLTPDSFCWCRAWLNLSSETIYGDTVWFFTGNPIPNWDFEDWTTKSFEVLNNWYMVGICEKVIENDRTYLAMLPVVDPDHNSKTSAILNARIDGEVIDNTTQLIYAGGSQISQKPLELHCSMRYSVHENDSALVICVLKSNGEYVAEHFFWITGSSGQAFVDTVFYLNYYNESTPDTLILGFAASNPLQEEIVYNSRLDLERFWFDVNIEIPNQNLNEWTTVVYDIPEGWISHWNTDFMWFESLESVLMRTEESYHNNYALCLQAVVDDYQTRMGELALKPYGQYIPICNNRHKNTELYYKYFPEPYDTATINVMLYSGGVEIANGFVQIFEEQTQWKKLTIPFNYYYDLNPDGLNIVIRSTKWENIMPSLLCVDKICFDGDFIPVNTPTVQNTRLFPNPAHDYIVFEMQGNSHARAEVLNLQGQLLGTHHVISGENYISVKTLPSGIYLIRVVSSEATIQYLRFIKQ